MSSISELLHISFQVDILRAIVMAWNNCQKVAQKVTKTGLHRPKYYVVLFALPALATLPEEPWLELKYQSSSIYIVLSGPHERLRRTLQLQIDPP